MYQGFRLNIARLFIPGSLLTTFEAGSIFNAIGAVAKIGSILNK